MGLYIGWNQGGRVRTLRELLVRRPMRANIGKIELRKSCFHFGILGMSSRGPPRVSARVDNQFRFGIAGSCMLFNGPPTWAYRHLISPEIGRAHVLTPFTNPHLVCLLLLYKQLYQNSTLFSLLFSFTLFPILLFLFL